MTFSEAYNKAIDNDEYDFRIVRYNPNGTINIVIKYYHGILITEDGSETTEEMFLIPLRWLKYTDWKLELK